jgi:hypothetical protein
MMVSDIPVTSICCRSVRLAQRANNLSTSACRIDSAFCVSEAMTGTATRD